MKAHHIGIVVKDLDKAIETYVNLGFEQASKIFVVDKPQFGIRFSFVRAGGMLFEFIEPNKGPWLEKLQKGGDGSMWEICFVVENIDDYFDKMCEKGIILEDRFEKPLTKDTIIPSDATGNKFGYLPKSKTNGVWIEVLEQAGEKIW